MPGCSSSATSERSRELTTSNPFDAMSKGTRRKSAERLSSPITSRNASDGIAATTKSASAAGSTKNSARTVSGSTKPGRYRKFSRLDRIPAISSGSRPSNTTSCPFRASTNAKAVPQLPHPRTVTRIAAILHLPSSAPHGGRCHLVLIQPGVPREAVTQCLPARTPVAPSGRSSVSEGFEPRPRFYPGTSNQPDRPTPRGLNQPTHHSAKTRAITFGVPEGQTEISRGLSSGDTAGQPRQIQGTLIECENVRTNRCSRVLANAATSNCSDPKWERRSPSWISSAAPGPTDQQRLKNS